MDGSIQKYMAFVKTVECGSFTKAAEQLSYSQSGISRMINDLEKECNVVLLERSKSGVKLTSRFSSAGLNQTCHRISAVINVNMESSLPLYTFSSHNEFEFLLSENIIVGAVPDGFITSSVF